MRDSETAKYNRTADFKILLLQQSGGLNEFYDVNVIVVLKHFLNTGSTMIWSS